MDINLRHQYLGTRPEPIHKARLKVIIGLIGITFSAGVMIADDMQLIKHQVRISVVHLKTKLKRPRRTKSLFE